MTRKQKRTVQVVVWLVILVGGGLWARHAFNQVREQSLIKSCYNHCSFIPWALAEYFPGRAETFHELPYDPDLPGYGMLAKYEISPRSVASSGSSDGSHSYQIRESGHGQNCHHGAPNYGNGGWNAVNLPPEKWEKLWAAHLLLRERNTPEQSYAVQLPFFWCGGPNSVEARAGGWASNWDGEWTIDKGYVDDEQLAHLNDCLVAIGEPPMDWDVPKGIDWAIYSNDDSYKRIPDHIGADGEVVYRITPRRGEVAEK